MLSLFPLHCYPSYLPHFIIGDAFLSSKKSFNGRVVVHLVFFPYFFRRAARLKNAARINSNQIRFNKISFDKINFNKINFNRIGSIELSRSIEDTNSETSATKPTNFKLLKKYLSDKL